VASVCVDCGKRNRIRTDLQVLFTHEFTSTPDVLSSGLWDVLQGGILGTGRT
jgi:hypothetical protein